MVSALKNKSSESDVDEEDVDEEDVEEIEKGAEALTSELAVKWMFFCFQGINVLLVDGHEKHVVGLQERQLTIISIFGRPYQKIYS